MGGVSKAAKNATATERLIHLAVPKKESPLFLGGREGETVVTSAAKKSCLLVPNGGAFETEKSLERPLFHRKPQTCAPNHKSHKICTKISSEWTHPATSEAQRIFERLYSAQPQVLGRQTLSAENEMS